MIQTTTRYLLPAMLNTTRPFFRMLALPISLFTSAGVRQSAALTCRYHVNAASRASAYAGLLSRNAFSVLSAMTLTVTDYHSPRLGPNVFAIAEVSSNRPSLRLVDGDEAADEDARAFYQRFDFEPSPVDPLQMLLLVKDIKRAAGLA